MMCRGSYLTEFLLQIVYREKVRECNAKKLFGGKRCCVVVVVVIFLNESLLWLWVWLLWLLF